MSEKLITTNEAAGDVPAKFQDEKGALKSDALLTSYKELEKKMGRMVSVPSDDASDQDRSAFYRALGVPETADGYKIDVKHQLLASDPEVNEQLRSMGFTNKQVQAVYDLAADRILPIIEDLARDYEAERQKEYLAKHFGGDDAFNEVSRQISAWAKTNVSPEMFDALATTSEGVIALYQMMQKQEPALLSGEPVVDVLDEGGLKKLMMDPKYWKDQDPAILQKVADGFKRLYPNKR